MSADDQKEEGPAQEREAEDKQTKSDPPHTNAHDSGAQDPADKSNGSQGSSTASAYPFLDEAPRVIDRPMSLVDGRTYAVTTVHLRSGSGRNPTAQLVVRDDGVLFSASGMSGTRSVGELGIKVEVLDLAGAAESAWSGGGVIRFSKGERPEPADVFRRISAAINNFVDFNKSIAGQGELTDLIACFVIATYCMPTFDQATYVWVTGDRGSGKTQLLATMSQLAFLGKLVLAGCTYPTIRDEIGCGATLCFDEAERIDDKTMELLLSGSRRGATAMHKEPVNDREWKNRRVSVFGPKCFCAISQPASILASRSIVIPMVRSADRTRNNLNPNDPSIWPVDRRRLIDDLWSLGLANVLGLIAYVRQIPDRSRLTGRNLDPWVMPLAVALWLEEVHDVAGLFKRLEQLSVEYQKERQELESGLDLARLVVQALMQLMNERRQDPLVFETQELTSRVSALSAQNSDDDLPLPTSAYSVGRALSRLRLTRAMPGKTRRRWQTTRREVENLAQAYGLSHKNAENAENAARNDEGEGDQS